MEHQPNISQKLRVTCTNCSLNSLCIPRGLAKDDVDRIADIVGRRKTLARGEYLYRRGDSFRGIIAIKAGTAKLIAQDRRGEEFVSAFLLPGELLGFDGLSTDIHQCSAIALETFSYCELPAAQLDSLCKEVPKLLRELFRHAGKSIDSATDLALLAKRPAEARVAAFLADLSERLQQRGFSGAEFRLSLTRQEIGEYLGMALETVSRILSQFASQGVITINSRNVQILDTATLNRIARGDPWLKS
ncbi:MULTISPECIES: helix-turn-helix domain-containing protein [Methylococcus]|jgi:CRP/FNR family transcriptional regulator|uniref:Transcriptional regulator, Crp/Fnr family n=2 Tax=Methylococcus capsulatus TaxID=414 RepID=Q606A2_METCA|nr:helix-turn-helix domain-containing protein [Methylococcus capsulatus]AAU91868.1 transcriptional regulator, Crp/Fnr family [Methylococcus capsulatus str. Bath]QXP87272.1 helix-turn-helix domain-containing protein [Methylococcus capsulatus]QXP91375.1 helix-turn-helix domain-containing protein [Methylococcus capsulatus]QXP92987.1 helix-turn-helix domain-containing protein [Methylococcus capsulatus]UQN12269.1 helix-turn-helix domain-containing protein [Methylococcus capsulatus]